MTRECREYTHFRVTWRGRAPEMTNECCQLCCVEVSSQTEKKCRRTSPEPDYCIRSGSWPPLEAGHSGFSVLYRLSMSSVLGWITRIISRVASKKSLNIGDHCFMRNWCLNAADQAKWPILEGGQVARYDYPVVNDSFLNGILWNFASIFSLGICTHWHMSWICWLVYGSKFLRNFLQSVSFSFKDSQNVWAPVAFR
jgi:hypothetical protein